MTLYRKAEREAFCRLCDGAIKKGDYMVSWYSYRNRGQHIHLHPECVQKMQKEVEESMARVASESETKHDV